MKGVRLPLLRGRSASWGFVTEMATLGVSLLTFIVVSERLGPGRFGLLAAVLSTIALVGPLLTASPEHVLVQRIAQEMPVDRAWQRSLSVLLFVGPLVALAMVLAANYVAPAMPVPAVLLITFGEVSLLGVARVAIRAHEAVGDSRTGARVAIANLVTRSVSLAMFVLSETSTITAWAALHVAAAAAAAIYAQWTLREHVGAFPRISLPSAEDYRLGLPFALNAGPDGLLSNNDKMVLSGSGREVDAGIYAAAYRIASIAGVPARSILRTRYASYFRKENQSVESALSNVRSILRATVPAGFVSGVLLFLFAPATKWILGEDFGESVTALRYLAFLPMVRSISTPCANVLTGTGRQRLRIMGTAGAAILNLCLNLLFVPSYGWQAAAATTLAAEVALLAWVVAQVRRPGNPHS